MNPYSRLNKFQENPPDKASLIWEISLEIEFKYF